MIPPKTPASLPVVLLGDIKSLIEEGRRQAATAVNMGLTLLYWRVGRRINAEILQDERAAYGEQIVATLSRQLTIDHGRSFGVKNLRHMMRFAEVFPEENIVYALSRQLSWTHFRALLYLDKPFQRDFYAEMCRIEGWSVRTPPEVLRRKLHEAIATARARIEAKGGDGGQEGTA
jgi:hypothetical protein